MVPSLSGRCSQTKLDFGYAGASIASARCARRMACSICSVNATRSIHADRIYPFTPERESGFMELPPGSGSHDHDDSAGVAIGKRIASAHRVEVGGESANIVPRNDTPVAAAKAFLDDGEGDGLIHLEERHRGVARVVLEFAHDAMIAALDNLFANVDVRQFFRPQHLHAAGHLILMFRVERIRVLFAFVVVKGCVAIESRPTVSRGARRWGGRCLWDVTASKRSVRQPGRARRCSESDSGCLTVSTIIVLECLLPRSPAYMKSVMNQSLSSSRRSGLRQRFGSSMSSHSFNVGSDIAEEGAAGG